MMFNMHTINTRHLAHHAREVRKLLAAGHTLHWTSRGKLIARLEPPIHSAGATRPDWIARATKAGAINRTPQTVSQALYEDRG